MALFECTICSTTTHIMEAVNEPFDETRVMPGTLEHAVVKACAEGIRANKYFSFLKVHCPACTKDSPITQSFEPHDFVLVSHRYYHQINNNLAFYTGVQPAAIIPKTIDLEKVKAAQAKHKANRTQADWDILGEYYAAHRPDEDA